MTEREKKRNQDLLEIGRSSKTGSASQVFGGEEQDDELLQFVSLFERYYRAPGRGGAARKATTVSQEDPWPVVLPDAWLRFE